MPVTEAREIYNKLQYTLFNVYKREDPDEFLQKGMVYGQERTKALLEFRRTNFYAFRSPLKEG